MMRLDLVYCSRIGSRYRSEGPTFVELETQVLPGLFFLVVRRKGGRRGEGRNGLCLKKRLATVGDNDGRPAGRWRSWTDVLHHIPDRKSAAINVGLTSTD